VIQALESVDLNSAATLRLVLMLADTLDGTLVLASQDGWVLASALGS
jgi:hypothetical protein